MNRLFVLISFLTMTTLPAAQPQPSAGPAAIQRITKTDRSGTAWSVRVPDSALVFTGQVAASDHSGDSQAQADGALRALDANLAKAGSDLTRVVRLNAYVADDRSIAGVKAAVAARFAAAPPAFTLVRTPLAAAGAKVAFEAVAATSRAPSAVEVLGASAAVLPAGGKIFISGQAIKGTDLASSVKLTMAGLHRSVAHLGLKKSDIAQVKAFITPFGDHAAAAREVAASFDGAPVPPTVMLEWVSELFTEIEIVVSARSLSSAPPEPITYDWFPWLTKSPRYSHVGFVTAGTPLIFIGAIDGAENGDARVQMKLIFERLGSVLFEAGSSYRNLAKATYYLADPQSRALLGDIRGVYFDPTRPPAASALGVNGLGHVGRAAMLDIVAVPVK